MQVGFSESVNFDSVRRRYQDDRRVRIENVLLPGVAQDMASTLSQLSYTNAFVNEGNNQTITHQALQSMSVPKRQQFFQSLYTQASKGVGFFYGRQPLLADTNSPLDNVLAWLNSADTLNNIKFITGCNDIDHASA
jgi:SM-20-related protein